MRWLLPEHIDDILPAEAGRIESLRRRLLDLFASYGYELVIPPLLEYVESLLTGTGRDLDLMTFKLVDQLSGRMMGVRADITPQVARIDAHLLNRKGVARLCYAGSVLHARPAGLAATREPLQVGAEIYGHGGIESDLEIQQLLCGAIGIAGVHGARITVGHVEVFRSILRSGGVGSEAEVELFEALQKKDLPALRGLTRRLGRTTREALLVLPELYGGPEILDLARRRLPGIPALRRALAVLRALARACTLPVSFDLAELRGYHYHSGVVFDAWCAGAGGAGSTLIARGGRYDEVGRAFGRPRPATGFSINLRECAGAGIAMRPRGAILAPYRRDAKLAAIIARLRAAGETVIEDLPGHGRTRGELGCSRALVKRGGTWTIRSIDTASGRAK